MDAKEHIVGVDNMPTEDEQLDPEVVALCEALNSLSGVETVQSCCGHARYPFRVWFKVSSSDPPCEWMIEGPTGEKAYQQAKLLACALTGGSK
jgi:hypothetical protein